MRMSTKMTKRIGILIACAILVAQLFPIHLHIHDHSSQNNNDHIASEIQFTNFEADTLDHHKHATVVSLNDNFANKKTSHDFNTDLLFLLAILFLLVSGLVALRIQRIQFNANPLFFSFFFRPILRAPPALFS